MKELLDKLSSYNLFNYLLPGTLFVAAAERISDLRFTTGNIVVDIFVFYFMGLVISRFGSLVVGPTLKKISFVKFAPYKDFIPASDQDPKIEILSEQNNMYRTLCALFLALPILKGLDVGAVRLRLTPTAKILITSVGLVVLFAFAYRKQSSFIRKRVEARAAK